MLNSSDQRVKNIFTQVTLAKVWVTKECFFMRHSPFSFNNWAILTCFNQKVRMSLILFIFFLGINLFSKCPKFNRMTETFCKLQ